MKIKSKLIRYILYFVSFSFIGLIFEYLLGSVFYSKGIYGLFHIKIPLLFFYGFGFLILVYFEKYIYSKKASIYFKGLINGLIIISYELFGGLVSILVFGNNLWDYSNHILNFMGIISLPASLIWITSGYLFTIFYQKRKDEF